MSDPAETFQEPGMSPIDASEEAALAEMRPVPRISIQAFCATEGVSKPIERATADRRMSRAQVKTHMGNRDIDEIISLW